LEAADHLINHFVSEFIVYHKNQRTINHFFREDLS